MTRSYDTGKAVRCAIYTRKSTDEGLEQEFNSLDAQRESAESYIASQRHEGWACLPDRYDDGGFTGGNMERPALKRLLADIQAGRIDCIVVYKVDCLSRSLLDFARIMETLEKHSVSFVSVTQQFNTTSSMGRLTLNILLSFAQFEREIISERTRDKMRAARRKGKWTGGRPVLGYDVDPKGGKLIVNDDEAARVRAIFELYMEREALLAVVKELDTRGWCNKLWVTRKGREAGGRPFTKTTLYKPLTNVTYVGKLTCNKECHDGEHPAIIDMKVYERVQALLRRNGRSGGSHVRNRFGALLKGILRCAPCSCAMTHTFTKKGNRRYRYYVCLMAQKRGWHTCPTKSVPALEIEKFVVDQIRGLGRDDALVAETIRQAREQSQDGIEALEAERKALEREMERDSAALRRVASEAPLGQSVGRMAELHDRIRAAEQRATRVREEVIALGKELVDEEEAARALALFDPVWDTLAPREQARIIHLLVEQASYDGEKGTVSVTFHRSGIKAITQEFAEATT